MLPFFNLLAEENQSINYRLVRSEDGSIGLQEYSQNIAIANTKAYENVYLKDGEIVGKEKAATYNELQRSFSLYTEGNLAFLNNEYDKAIEYYSESLNISASANCLYNRALAYSIIASTTAKFSLETRKEYFEKAVVDYSWSIMLSPNDSAAYNNRATVYIKLGLLEKARDDLRMALQLSPEDIDIINNINKLAKEF